MNVNIGSSKGIPMKQLVKDILVATNSSSKILLLPQQSASWRGMDVDGSQGRQLLGFSPKVCV